MNLARWRCRAVLAVATGAGALALASPASAVTLPTFDRTAIDATGDGPSALAIGSLNGDERTDALAANGWSKDATLYGNIGGADLAAFSTAPFSSGAFVSDIELGDIDGDGDLDAVASQGVLGSAALLRNDGAGHFALQQVISVGSGVSGVVVGDVNGDARADAVVNHNTVLGDNVDGGYKVLLGSPDGTLADQGHQTVVGVMREMALADVDGDDRIDLIAGERDRVGSTWTGATDGIVVRPGNGAGGFGEPTLYDAGDPQITDDPAYADITGDGVADLVATNQGTFLSIWRGLGDGAFAAPTTRQVSIQAIHADQGDVNDDGILDYVIANSQVVEAYLGTAGSDNPSVLIQPEESPYKPGAVAIGDLDGDGDDDIVTSSVLDFAALGVDKINVFENTTAPPPPPAPQCADGLDNDADGNADLADAGCSSAQDDDESDDPLPPPPAKQCADGLDNDSDGNVDGADAGCSNADDDDESDDPAPPTFWPFVGFYKLYNPPTLNVVDAGHNVELKFETGGYRGLDIYADGYPRSETIPCGSGIEVEVEGVETTISDKELHYHDEGKDRDDDPLSFGFYHYQWRSSKLWKGTCRQLVVKLDDGSYHRVNVRFK